MSMNMNNQSQLTDKDIATDALNFHKQMTNLASLGCLESASQAGLQAFQQIQQNELSHSRQLYQLMNQRGWYTPQPATPNTQSQGQGQSQQSQSQNRVLDSMIKQSR